MISYSLSADNRNQLASAFADVPRVDISIQCVLEDAMGKAFVDSPEHPHRYMIELDEFFCYYAGDLTSEAGRDFVNQTPGGRMLMAGTEGWHDVVQTVLSDRLMTITRYSYQSDTLSATQLTNLVSSNPHIIHVQQLDSDLINKGIPYLEIGAFASPEDFVTRGVGYTLIKDEKSIGVAYSSLACNASIEVSIVVDEAYRRQGIATALASKLLLWCLEHNKRPNWDAANEESCRLAEKLGYTDKQAYTAYFLK